MQSGPKDMLQGHLDSSGASTSLGINELSVNGSKWDDGLCVLRELGPSSASSWKSVISQVRGALLLRSWGGKYTKLVTMRLSPKKDLRTALWNEVAEITGSGPSLFRMILGLLQPAEL